MAPNLADVAIFYDCSLKNVQTNNGTYGLKEPEIGPKCTLPLMFGMAIRVVEFSNGGYKIRKIFA